MPTYSYRCTSCDNAFDITQAFTDDSLTTCQKCEMPLRKVFSAIGVTFQGSGFYRTDSRAEAKKSAAAAQNSDKKGAPSAPAKKETATAASASTSSSSSTSSGSTSSGSTGSGSTNSGSSSSQ
jgi:putative FmdB family regulatory protein